MVVLRHAFFFWLLRGFLCDIQLTTQVVGVLVCFFGLCSGIYTQFYKSFFMNHVSEFLLFMGVACSAVILVFGGLVSNIQDKTEKMNGRKVSWCYGLGITIAVYLATENGM